MQIQYRLLVDADQPELERFCSDMKYSKRLRDWTLQGFLSHHPMFLISGEFVDGHLNGVMTACSLGYFFGTSEFVPTWAGIRIDRIKAVNSFTTFMHLTSSLITDHFEARGYFHHYIARRLPRRIQSNLQLSEATRKTFAQGPYLTFVECVVASQKEFDDAPSLFRQMIGTYTHPLVVLSMNMINDEREARRNHDPRTSISL